MHRIEIRLRDGDPDAAAASVLDEARRICGDVESVRTARVYLVEAPLDEGEVERVARVLLSDPINQDAVIGTADAAARGERGRAVIEVQYKPGVMDPVAESTREAIAEMLPRLGRDEIEVRTGFRFDLVGPGITVESARRLARTALANPVIQDIHDAPFAPQRFPRGTACALKVVQVPIRDLDKEALTKLSRDGHLFLSLEEMKAIQSYYRVAAREPTDIELETLAQTWSEHCVHKTLKADIHYQASGPEAAIPGLSAGAVSARPGHELQDDGSITIRNLLKSTIVAATRRLMEDKAMRDWCISVFEDNAGVVRFDEADGIAIKVETHNHPSAIDPYGGAATGIGGCIRDIMGTGLSARPIANTDTFAVAWSPESRVQSPESGSGDRESRVASRASDAAGSASESRGLEFTAGDPDSGLPKGIIHPRHVLQQVVAGVRDYGNRMGIPTVNGAVYFDDDYLGNPLVFAGCVGIIPIQYAFGEPEPGDRILVLGGRTGRDGIHGATFSSAELTDTHADEFSHAVQIGNAITQKKMMDVILQARGDPCGGISGGISRVTSGGDASGGAGPDEKPLFNAITDCGAGGFSSAVGEMGAKIGARVTLETAPLKYEGLSYTEIWISEAQERMVLAVPPQNLERLRRLCEAEDVEVCDLGAFGAAGEANEPQLVLTFEGTEVGRLSMSFLHEGIPTPTRLATWGSHAEAERAKREQRPSDPPPSSLRSRRAGISSSLSASLLALLSHLNICSKHWIVRQYDHEVQGGSVIKPLVGPFQDGPGDAAVLRPKLSSDRGIAIGAGLQPGIGEKAVPDFALDGDSYWMALASIDEAVRNVVCVGADPKRIALLDNFCWASCDDPDQLGALVRAAEACHDGALAYHAPFVSGKDSLNNQFTTEDGLSITIPPTLLITSLGIVSDVWRCLTMAAKSAGNVLLIVGQTTAALGGSHYVRISLDRSVDHRIPRVDLEAAPRAAVAVADLIERGLVQSAHDCSDGGLLVAASEMAFAGRIGLDLDLSDLPAPESLDPMAACFAESPGRYLLEVEKTELPNITRTLSGTVVPHAVIGTFAGHDRLTVKDAVGNHALDIALDLLRDAWLRPLDW